MQGKPFLAFVYGIAAHKVIDAHRAVSRGRTDPVADVPDSVEIDAGPEQRVLHGELSAQLRALLDELPEKQREILVLRIVVGLSAEETAEIVGASPGAVRVAQHRALGKLRKNIPPGLALSSSRPGPRPGPPAGVRPPVPGHRTHLGHWRCSRRVEGTR